jgi:hypothetical protein
VTGPAQNSTRTIRLPEKWTRFLVRQPESGMSYQRVDVRLANNREIKDAVVLKLARLPAYSLLPSSFYLLCR